MFMFEFEIYNFKVNLNPNQRQVHLLHIIEALPVVIGFEYHVPLPLVEKTPPVLQHKSIAALFN